MRILITTLLATLVLVAPALAAPPGTKPSNAQTITVGQNFKAAEDNGTSDVWRLASAMNPGEQLQLAVDNTQGSTSLGVCLLPSVDDFGYDAAVSSACSDDDDPTFEYVGSGRSARITLKFEGAAGQPLLRVNSYNDAVDLYNITPEAVIPVPPPAPPDTDNDGIPDAADGCPQSSGKAPSGCPDDDGDGIPDVSDACKFTRGAPTAAGCPDADGDGVRDEDDKCATAIGVAPTGCPDRDRDGVVDTSDRCPALAGRNANGCPDKLRYVTTISLKRSGRRFSGRISSPDASCAANRKVRLRKVGAGKRIYGTATSRADGSFTIRVSSRLRGRLYVVAAERTLTTKQCRVGTSRRVR